MIQFPPMETFNDGELQDGKKLAKKVLEESAELMVASPTMKSPRPSIGATKRTSLEAG